MIVGNKVRVPESVCPYCGATMDAAQSVGVGDTPSPGDLTVCIECVQPMLFIEGLAVRKLTDEEMGFYLRDPSAQQLAAGLRAYHQAQAATPEDIQAMAKAIDTCAERNGMGVILLSQIMAELPGWSEDKARGVVTRVLGASFDAATSVMEPKT